MYKLTIHSYCTKIFQTLKLCMLACVWLGQTSTRQHTMISMEPGKFDQPLRKRTYCMWSQRGEMERVTQIMATRFSWTTDDRGLGIPLSYCIGLVEQRGMRVSSHFVKIMMICGCDSWSINCFDWYSLWQSYIVSVFDRPSYTKDTIKQRHIGDAKTELIPEELSQISMTSLFLVRATG